MKKAKLIEQKTKDEKEMVSNTFSIKKLLVIIAIIILVLAAFYFITDYFIKNRKTDEQANPLDSVNVRESNDIDYSYVDKMVASSYYLLIDKPDDENNDQYDQIINLLKYSSFPIEFYYIDLGKDANKSLLADKSSLKSLDDLKVKDTTLILVSDGEIKETYEGSEAITNHLFSYFTTSTDESDSNSNSNQTETSNKEDTSNK